MVQMGDPTTQVYNYLDLRKQCKSMGAFQPVITCIMLKICEFRYFKRFTSTPALLSREL